MLRFFIWSCFVYLGNNRYFNTLMKKTFFAAMILLFINCKKEVKVNPIPPIQTVCDNTINRFIIDSKSKQKLKKIFMDYRFGMSKKEFDDYSEKYIKKEMLRRNDGDTLWIQFPDKSYTERKQYFLIFPYFENDSLKEINLYSPYSHKDYNHYNQLLSKYPKPKFNHYCEFFHQVLWEFENGIVFFSESESDNKSQFISYRELKYAKRKALLNQENAQDSKRKESIEKQKIKDSLDAQKKAIDDVL